MSRIALLVVAGAIAAVAAGPAVAAPHVQTVSLTIRAGDRLVEPSFALAAGVPVRVRVTNFTREFHTFTVPGLGLSALIRPASGAAPQTTTVAFTPHAVGTFAWHCVICPSGAHGQPHAMDGTIYLIVDPSVFG